ncbi:MAG: MATE family efflux transporter [Rhodobacterales bacterium]|nr:MATE family efflux transporter [Rhodobacterales bacterium]
MTATPAPGAPQQGATPPATPGNLNRQVWRLAGPIMLSNISVPLLGLVDTAVVGHLPDPRFLGAVAVGAMVFTTLYWAFGFFRMGTGGLTAQARGAGDMTESRAILGRGMAMAVVGGLGLILLQVPLGHLALALVGPSETVAPLSQSYVSIRIWSAPAALMNYVLLGWLLGMQAPGKALVMEAGMNGINIVLDLLFVLHFGWGVEGVAAATLIAEVSAVFLGLAMLRGTLRRHPGAWSRARILDRASLARLVRLNRDIFLRSMLLHSAFLLFTAIGARMGDTVLAANAVLLNFQYLMTYALDGFSDAAQALVGSAVGARDRPLFRATVAATARWALLFACGFSLAYAVAGDRLIDLVTDIQEVRDLARAYLPWAMALPLVAVWSFLLDGIFLGATRAAEMRNGMVAAALTFAGTAFGLVPLIGNHGLWAAMILFMLARALALWAYYPRLSRGVAA